jgi:hypothetical protein
MSKGATEKRLKKFTKLFTQMMTYAADPTYSEFREILMKMLYLFLLSKAKPIVPKKLEPAVENLSSPEGVKRRVDSGASPPDLLPHLETSSNSKYDSNPHMDLAKLKGEFEPSNVLELDKKLMLSTINERPVSDEALSSLHRQHSLAFDQQH